MTNVCSIKNNSGTITLPVSILSWESSKESVPAIRDVPTGTSQYLDGGTYVLTVGKGTMTCRLSSAERDYLNQIFDESKMVFIYLQPVEGITGWRMIAWLKKKDFDYQYRKENGIERVWFTTLEFNITEDKYYTNLATLTEG